MADWLRLSSEVSALSASGQRQQARTAKEVAEWVPRVARSCVALTKQMQAEATLFRATDVVQIMTAACNLSHRHPPLFEVVATHALRGMLAYPLFALCNIANCFARLSFHHSRFLDSTAAFLAQPTQARQLSPVDIASLVFAYAELAHRSSSALLDSCAERLKDCSSEIGGPNCAIILNSFARLSECNPGLFQALSRSVLETRPESFDVHHISLTMNAMAKCKVRKPQLMQVLAGHLVQRGVQQLSPQNVCNVVHAFAKLECYQHPLFYSLQTRIVTEDLSSYKTFELAVLAHSLAKLRCGGKKEKLYECLFAEFSVRRAEWEPQAVVQVLDALRRRRLSAQEPLLLLLMARFLKDHERMGVHPLTQGAWCLVELDALPLAGRLPPGTLSLSSEEAGGGESLCAMRMIFEQMERLGNGRPFTTTQQLYVQQLVKSYRFKYEVDYGLLPPKTKTFCKALFDVPTPVVTSVARRAGFGSSI